MQLQCHTACCKPVLQGSTELWGLQFASNSVAVHWCWDTADLCEQQILIGVSAVSHCLLQACLAEAPKQAVFPCTCTCGDLFCIQCALTQHQCTAARFRAKCSPHCSLLLCKTGSKTGSVPLQYAYGVCSSYRCAVTQHQCTAARFRAKCSPHCSLLLCKTGSKTGSVPLQYTYGVCSSYRCALTQHQCTAAR